ncbi:uncharacterized protein LOC102346001 isoform X2 [Latimeria chalumnae]|uniref:uncharacterized protein LOC102346001 isoform X2 n=1 Tax=Latimeria chalumnae TaxID=7897 RepID=UPI0006D90D4E|nr:PREDICTED: uncharacterized protein LOC102346001 isoform X2 [Latimeria chalumnae]|eukprot:XP_014340774.1 PREDICTED: uncharacterized protein LOC102346001 isoform X2 [Latimeria chalumnae]
MAFFLWWLSVAVSFHLSETLEVRINPSLLRVQRNEDVLLECLITGFESAKLDLSIVRVQWYLIPSANTDRRELLYFFSSSNATAARIGSQISEEELKKGNASLYLPRIKVSEEGTYECIVHILQLKAQRACKVLISARPEVQLSPQELTLEAGTEESLLCQVKNFYPNTVEIIWMKISDGKSERVTVAVCTGATTVNNDGTYALASRLKLQPSLQDNGNTYQCIVKHQALPEHFAKDCVLSVKDPEAVLSKAIIIGSIIGCMILILICLIVGLFLKSKHFKMGITRLQSKLQHSSCFLKMKNDTKKTSYWNSEATEMRGVSAASGEGCVLLPKGEKTYEQDKVFKVQVTDLTPNSDGTYNLRCNIEVFADVHTPNTAEGLVNSDLKMQLNTVRASPRMSPIVVPPCITHSELLALTCPVNGFKPRPLTIVWCKRHHDGRETEVAKLDSQNREEILSTNGSMPQYSHSISESQNGDGTFSIISVLAFVPTIKEDHEATFICKVFHDATKYEEKKETKLIVKAIPKFDPIQCSPDVYFADHNLTLSCRIHSFYPSSVKVSWYKENNLMVEKQDTEIVEQADDLFYCTSSVKFVPCKNDAGKMFKCFVEHETLTEPKEIEWKMTQLISPPVVTGITCEPEIPEVGKPLTLSCVVRDFYPPDCNVMWVRGFERTEDGITTEDPELDTETGLYFRKSQRTFIPTEHDQGMEFTVELFHYNMTYRNDTNGYYMTFSCN